MAIEVILIIMIEVFVQIIMTITVEDFEVGVVSIEEVVFLIRFHIEYTICLLGRGNNNNNNSQTRFFPRGNHRGSGHDHSSSRRSSRSPDRRSSSYRNDHNTDKYSSSGFAAPPSEEFSHRALPVEALRKKDQSNMDSPSNNSNKSSSIIDDTIGGRTGHAD